MSDQTQMSESEKKKEDWMNNKWRPMMGWLYMGTCTFDFVIFPILWSLLQAITKAPQITQWQPLTLQGAGLYHIAMGAVLGLAAFGRTQEKLAGANNGGLNTPTSGLPTGGFGGGMPAPRTVAPSPSFGTPAPVSSFGSPALGANFAPAGTLPPLPTAPNQATGNPTKTPAAVDDPDA